MSNPEWSKLTPLQLGRFAESYAKTLFQYYGYRVYSPEVDDHGVDFVAKAPGTEFFYEVQVKSIRKQSYTFIHKEKIRIDDSHLVCLLHFEDCEMPEVYVFKATVWNSPNAVFKDNSYDKEGQKSKPEWGISYSKKNLEILEQYRAEEFFKREAARLDLK